MHHIKDEEFLVWVLGTLCRMQLDLFLSPLFIMLLSAVDDAAQVWQPLLRISSFPLVTRLFLASAVCMCKQMQIYLEIRHAYARDP